jgi:hypothetical protein
MQLSWFILLKNDGLKSCNFCVIELSEQRPTEFKSSTVKNLALHYDLLHLG